MSFMTSAARPLTVSVGRARDLTWSDAYAVAGRAAGPLPAVPVGLEEAAGRILAQEATARVAAPAVDCAAMDGYAVAGSGPWRMVGRQVTGPPVRLRLEPGTSVEIATGAPVPAGCDAVLPYEQAARADDLVHGEVVMGRHVRRSGEDIQAGSVLARPGSVVSAAMVGLLSASGGDRVMVRARPRVAIVTTGAEIVMTGVPGAGQVRDAIAPTMTVLVARFGGQVTVRRHAPGDRDELAEQIGAAAAVSDVVLVAGSSSRGCTDHLRSLIRPADYLVDGVDCRPGHPQLLARLSGGRWLVGFPGNPFAAVVAAYTLLRPLMDGMTGCRPRVLPRIRVIGAVNGSTDRTRLVPVRLTEDGSAEVLTGHGPANLLGAALMDGLAVLPAGWTGGGWAPVLPA